VFTAVLRSIFSIAFAPAAASAVAAAIADWSDSLLSPEELAQRCGAKSIGAA
jgi:hypothetical protein